jgi:hypothetical protein
MPSVRTVLVWLLAAIPAAAAAQGASAKSAPLTLRATCDAGRQPAMLHVQIANTSDQPRAVVLGFNAANGQTHVVDSIELIGIRPATGANEQYVYVNPKYALAKGPQWIVSLAPGATHAIDLPVSDFTSSLTFFTLDPAAVGGTRLIFEGRPSTTKSTPVWTGMIETVLEPCTP